jgi:nitrogen regulatory protein PII
MFFILFVLHDISKINDLLHAWEEAGVKGATVLISTGLGRIRQNFGLMEDFPLFPSMSEIMERMDEMDLSRTLFSVVESDKIVKNLLEKTQRVVGDLGDPNTGILIVLPVAQVFGLKSYSPD